MAFQPLTPSRISSLIEADFKASEARGIKESLWTSFVVGEGVVEAALKEMRGFVTVDGIVMNKYGGRELAKNSVVLGVRKAAGKRRRGKAGEAFLEEAGEKVRLTLCSKDDTTKESCKLLFST